MLWRGAGSGRVPPTVVSICRQYSVGAPNLLAQHFVATAPNRIWLAGITHIATGEGWLDLAAVRDMATRKLVKSAPSTALRTGMRDHMRTELRLAAMMMAAQRQRPDRGLHLSF